MRNQRMKIKIYTNLLLVLAIFAVVYIFLYPQYSGKGSIYNPEKSISALLVDKSDYTVALDVAASFNNRVIKTNRDYEEALNTLPIDKLNKILPIETDPILTIYELSLIAARPESKMSIISPRYVDNSAATGPNKKYSTLSISFSVEGTYEQMKAFLKNLENSEKIFNVVTMSFNSSRETRAGSLLTYSITLETYYLTK